MKLTDTQIYSLIAIFGVFAVKNRKHIYISDIRSSQFQVKALRECVSDYGLRDVIKTVLASYYINRLGIWGFSLLDTPKKLHNNIVTFHENIYRVFEGKDDSKKTLVREVFRLVERDIPSALQATGLTNIK